MASVESYQSIGSLVNILKT